MAENLRYFGFVQDLKVFCLVMDRMARVEVVGS